MAVSPQTAVLILVFQILCPFVGSAFLGSCFRNTVVRARIVMCIHFAMAASGAILSLLLLSQVYHGGPQTIEFTFSLWKSHGPLLANQIVWQINPLTAGIAALLPWISMTATSFAEPARLRGRLSLLHLLLVGTLQLFWLGGDLGSCLSGAFLSALILAHLMAWHGGEGRRAAASVFLTSQWCGGLLLMGGLGMILSATSISRNAPRGLPADSSTSLVDLVGMLRLAFENHSAAWELWSEARGLPIFLISAGLMVMAACFPLHVWLTRSTTVAPLSVRIWLLTWIKGVLLFGLRMISELDPEIFVELQGWGWAVALPGAMFTASLLLSQADFGRLLTAAFVWTQSVAIISACGATRDFPRLLAPLLISQLAGLCLLTITLSLIASRFRRSELGAYQGLSHHTGWLGPSLLASLLTLTLSPLCLGLFHGWLGIATLQAWGGGRGLIASILYVFANAMALAGLIKVIRPLTSGPFQFTENSLPGTATPAAALPPFNLSLTRMQTAILCFWGVTAIGIGLLFPLFLTLPAPVGAK